jgi:hypothetical protein
MSQVDCVETSYIADSEEKCGELIFGGSNKQKRNSGTKVGYKKKLYYSCFDLEVFHLQVYTPQVSRGHNLLALRAKLLGSHTMQPTLLAMDMPAYDRSEWSFVWFKADQTFGHRSTC